MESKELTFRGLLTLLGLAGIVVLLIVPGFPLPGLLGGLSAVLLTKGAVPLGFHFYDVWTRYGEWNSLTPDERLRAYYESVGLTYPETDEDEQR